MSLFFVAGVDISSSASWRNPSLNALPWGFPQELATEVQREKLSTTQSYNIMARTKKYTNAPAVQFLHKPWSLNFYLFKVELKLKFIFVNPLHPRSYVASNIFNQWYHDIYPSSLMFHVSGCSQSGAFLRGISLITVQKHNFIY